MYQHDKNHLKWYNTSQGNPAVILGFWGYSNLFLIFYFASVWCNWKGGWGWPTASDLLLYIAFHSFSAIHLFIYRKVLIKNLISIHPSLMWDKRFALEKCWYIAHRLPNSNSTYRRCTKLWDVMNVLKGRHLDRSPPTLTGHNGRSLRHHPVLYGGAIRPAVLVQGLDS